GLADQPLAETEAIGQVLSFVIGVTCQQTQLRFSVRGLVEVEHSMLHGYERGELGQNDGGDREEIPLALEEAREFGHIRFQPILGQRDLLAVSTVILSELAPLVSMQHGVFYLNEPSNGEPELRLLASYAYNERKHLSDRFRLRQGLIGQAAFEKQRMVITDAPPDYIQINSALGEARPLSIVVVPVVFEGDVKAVIELASFQRFTDIHLTFLDQLSEIIGIMLNTITATMRTEELLKQSQALAGELQTRQAELT